MSPPSVPNNSTEGGLMPINPLRASDYYQAPQDIGPDIRPDDNITVPVTIAMETIDVIPANFDQLTPEEQEHIKNRIRFRGIRLRGDLDNSVILTRETMDIP